MAIGTHRGTDFGPSLTPADVPIEAAHLPLSSCQLRDQGTPMGGETAAWVSHSEHFPPPFCDYLTRFPGLNERIRPCDEQGLFDHHLLIIQPVFQA